MQSQRLGIIEDTDSLIKECERTGDCKGCLAYQLVRDGTSTYDFLGCIETNDICKRTDEYNERIGINKVLQSSLNRLLYYNQIAAVMDNINRLPDRDNLLIELKQLKTILSEKVFDEKDRKIEMLPVEPEIYPAIRVSRRASKLI